MKKWLFTLVVVMGLWSGRAVADSYNANIPLHLASSATITYGLYALIHYGLGTKTKTPAYFWGATTTQIIGTMWEMGDTGVTPDHHLTQAMEMNVLGSAITGVCIWSFDL